MPKKLIIIHHSTITTIAPKNQLCEGNKEKLSSVMLIQLIWHKIGKHKCDS